MALDAVAVAPVHTSPTAKTMFAKLHSQAGQQRLAKADDDPGDGDHGVDADEAESVKLRGDFQQSITAAPGIAARADGLVAAQHAGVALPNSPVAWQDVTNKPFVNAPISGGQNYGVGWGDVTGRMTKLAHSGSTVYAATASGGSGDRPTAARTGRPSTPVSRVCPSARSSPARMTDRCGRARVRPITRPRTSTASGSTGSPGERIRGSRSAGPSSTAPGPTGSSGSTATSTSRPVTVCTAELTRRRTARAGRSSYNPTAIRSIRRVRRSRT